MILNKTRELPENKNTFEIPIEAQYNIIMSVYSKWRVIRALPKTELLGIQGPDGQEFTIPTLEEVNRLFEINKELVQEKMKQGFTQLTLTPIGAYVPLLRYSLDLMLKEYGANQAIFLTKENDQDEDVTAEVDLSQPTYFWDSIDEAVKSDDGMQYFLNRSKDRTKGKTKKEVSNDSSLCPVSGWIVGLTKDMPILPQKGQGKIIGGRKDLEVGLSVDDYEDAMQKDEYYGETGWTMEDMITDFMITLETKKRVSYEYYIRSAIWLSAQRFSASVPLAGWSRAYRRLYVYRDGPKAGNYDAGMRSTVRLLGV